MSQVLLGAAGWEGAQRVGKGAALVLQVSVEPGRNVGGHCCTLKVSVLNVACLKTKVSLPSVASASVYSQHPLLSYLFCTLCLIPPYLK